MFNFLSGRAKARDMLELADQYLAASIESGHKGHAGPAVDNLFSASELVSKAELILYRSKAAKARIHGPIASEINAWARLGNIDQAFVALFNKLGQQRPNARYCDRDHRPPSPDADSYELVRAMIARGWNGWQVLQIEKSILDEAQIQLTIWMGLQKPTGRQARVNACRSRRMHVMPCTSRGLRPANRLSEKPLVVIPIDAGAT